MNVIKSRSCDHSEVIKYLNTKLEKLGHFTCDCITCGNIKFENDIERWWFCSDCKEHICDKCSEGEKNIICEPCLNKREKIFICSTCNKSFNSIHICCRCDKYICISCSEYDYKQFGICCPKC